MIEGTTSRILQKLKELEKEEGNLPLLLEFYKKLLQIQYGAEERIGTLVPTISSDAVQTRLSKGLPLIGFDELALDWSLLQEVFAKVIQTFAEYPQLFGEIPDTLKKPGARHLLTKKAVKAWYIGKELPSVLLDGVSENYIQTVIQATLQPFLARHAEVFIGSVEQGTWRNGYCPICGGSPDLAYLEKEVGARWLLCSRCNSEWLFQRLECPYCGNQERNTLAFFSDDEELYRLYVCERCKHYLKAIDLRKAKTEVLLPLERFYTLDLDSQARERGYSLYQKPTMKTEQ